MSVPRVRGCACLHHSKHSLGQAGKQAGRRRECGNNKIIRQEGGHVCLVPAPRQESGARGRGGGGSAGWSF